MLLKSFKDSGAESEANVSVDISYDIIRHVSAQLYTSPRKAIEELICNGYDAGASQCHVALPKTTKDPLLVLDNGKSMNLDGLHLLWRVARSPKESKEGDPRIANNRMQIGKFGVGKLAAFALGDRLTYVACIKNTIRLISVGQNEIKDKPSGKAPSFAVLKLTLAKAKELLEPALGSLPKPWEKGWDSWTLALVEDIDQANVGNALRIALLKRMITTALPISAAFQVFLEGELVPRREIDPDNIEVTVDILKMDYRRHLAETLKEYWAAAFEEPVENIPEKWYSLSVETVPDPQNVEKTVKALIVPELGPVIGGAISTKTSLTTDKLHERGYSNNGFAVTARGKLINPEDPLFGVTERSHKYWSRFLARVEMPGLDKVLLVQRNAVSENSPQAQIAREVLRSLFNYTRKLVDEKEDEEQGGYEPPSFGQRLGTSAPILAQAALKGLLEGAVDPNDLKKLTIDYATLGVDGPAARFDAESKKILINSDHPLLTSMDELGAMSKAMRRVVGEVVAGIEISRGYLRARKVDEDIIAETEEMVDAAMRTAAEFVRDPFEDHIQDIDEASYEGDTPFEKAVVRAFRSLRLAARHLGESDQPDGIIEIPVSGNDNARISIEAKGSKGIITHKQLSEATVTRHSGDTACQYAVAIAREFATEGLSGKESALLRETKGKVPLLTVEAIALMLRLHKRRNFTYDKILKILTTWTHPDDLNKFVEDTWREIPSMGLMRLVLTVAHELIEGDSVNLPDPGMIVADARVRQKKIKKEDVTNILMTVQLTTRMVTIVDPKDNRFELNAPVQTILDAMQAEFDDSQTKLPGISS